MLLWRGAWPSLGTLVRPGLSQSECLRVSRPSQDCLAREKGPGLEWWAVSGMARESQQPLPSLAHASEMGGGNPHVRKVLSKSHLA